MTGRVEMDTDVSQPARKIKIRKSESSSRKIDFLHKINWRINVLCIIGAVLAVYAASVGWLGNRLVLCACGESPLGLAFHFGYLYSFAGGIMWAAIIFIVGALLTFITPLGGVVQLVGILWFMTAFWMIDNPSHQFSIDGNIVVGVISASISIFSMIKPIGINYRGRSTDLIGRLLTISIAER